MSKNSGKSDMRLTPEREKDIRTDYVGTRVVHTDVKMLLAEIDALRAERDELRRQVVKGTNVEDAAFRLKLGLEVIRLREAVQEALHRANEDDKITVPLSFILLLKGALNTNAQAAKTLPDYYYKGTHTTYTENDPEVTCGSCNRTFRTDPFDRTCRLCSKELGSQRTHANSAQDGESK